jgi:diguanylate cyclase (GGDEF)-like protein
MCIDLDLFKNVNDSFGHPMGDRLLKLVAERLREVVRDDNVAARLGGDEFAIVLAADVSPNEASAFAERLIDALSAPYNIDGLEVVVGASVGIALSPGDGTTSEELMRNADMALYRAKSEGGGVHHFFEPEMDQQAQKRRDLERDLRHAFANGEFELHYQPLVDNAADKISGFESLLRWRHPDKGMISPAEFVPVAEDIGLIVQLGEWVLRRACLDGKAWPDITVAVNVSPLQFRRTEFVDVVERILAETGFDPTRLELEVTESTLLGNVDTAELAMFRLKALGVQLALDDFGTGYSSLLYLRRFPFDKLKIDRSFVLSIERAADAAAIVHAVVSLGRGLGMKVTAEGVETAEQHLFLRAAGVHTMQGFRFGRPGSAAEFSARLAEPDSFRIKEDHAGLNLALAG